MDYEIPGRFLLAALWGGIVGAERGYHSKSARVPHHDNDFIGILFFYYDGGAYR
ncbi:MAG: hypothetical protein H7Y86_06880 [Rhizobacter sp.]|nr:hypothetical protein [Ferruginibacter sp.]